MDLRRTAGEIGLFETAINLSHVAGSAEVIRKAGETMPLPDGDIADSVSKIADWLHGLGKTKYMFLTPEIALIEELAKTAAGNEEAFITVPCGMDVEARERLGSNLPRGMKVSLLEEPYFPEAFYPGNGLLVICGYSAGGRAMVLPDTYRMAEHYQGFMGRKVFIPYQELETAVRYDGWIEVSRQKLTSTWRDRS